VEGAAAGSSIGFAGEDAAGVVGASVGWVAGAVPSMATSWAPELSLLVATPRAAAPAMLRVMKAIRPFLPVDPADGRRGSFC
jgi:hypothetical protein